MHLVVLRRNDITLPDELPLCLKPSNLKDKIIDRHNNKDLYDGNPRPLLDGTETDSLDFSLPNDTIKVLDTDSAVSPESLLSSPGRPKPVKFDFNAVDASKDPNIACPVPLRLSPDSPLLQSSEEDSPQTIGRQPPKVIKILMIINIGFDSRTTFFRVDFVLVCTDLSLSELVQLSLRGSTMSPYSNT